ncbi:hypothetical protein [Halorubrum sp. CSM-61]|uniref:hypothetical protein n=1 Tax=Halorubrum sp. CSM-61 TaxID=2485838 RepID=UPI0013DE6E73|nr:hypothetical protein [Halorubrum sp. CSM-61]
MMGLVRRLGARLLHRIDEHWFTVEWWPAVNMAVVSCVACDEYALDITRKDPSTDDVICERHPAARDADGTIIVTHPRTVAALEDDVALVDPDFKLRANVIDDAPDDAIREVGLYEVDVERMEALVESDLWDVPTGGEP